MIIIMLADGGIARVVSSSRREKFTVVNLNDDSETIMDTMSLEDVEVLGLTPHPYGSKVVAIEKGLERIASAEKKGVVVEVGQLLELLETFELMNTALYTHPVSANTARRSLAKRPSPLPVIRQLLGLMADEKQMMVHDKIIKSYKMEDRGYVSYIEENQMYEMFDQYEEGNGKKYSRIFDEMELNQTICFKDVQGSIRYGLSGSMTITRTK